MYLKLQWNGRTDWRHTEEHPEPNDDLLMQKHMGFTLEKHVFGQFALNFFAIDCQQPLTSRHPQPRNIQKNLFLTGLHVSEKKLTEKPLCNPRWN